MLGLSLAHLMRLRAMRRTVAMVCVAAKTRRVDADTGCIARARSRSSDHAPGYRAFHLGGTGNACSRERPFWTVELLGERSWLHG